MHWQCAREHTLSRLMLMTPVSLQMSRCSEKSRSWLEASRLLIRSMSVGEMVLYESPNSAWYSASMSSMLTVPASKSA